MVKRLPLKQFYIDHPHIQLITLITSMPIMLIIWFVLVVPLTLWGGIKYITKELHYSFKDDIVDSYSKSYRSLFARLRKKTS